MKTTNNASLSGMARCLIRNGLLQEETAWEYEEDAKNEKTSLINYLISKEIHSAESIALTLSNDFGIPLFDINVMDLALAPIDLVSEKLIRQHRVLPLYLRGNRLFLAISDPTNQLALDEIKFQTRKNTELVLVEDNKLTKAIENAFDAADTSMQDLLDEDLDNIDLDSGEEGVPGEGEDDLAIDDAPIVRFVNKILLDAIKKGASDVHIEPYEKIFRIRFRHDGMLHEVATPPTNMSHRIISRLKVMSKMNIAERRIPQDGRIKMKLSKNKAIDFRVNTCPTLFGEKVVLRILDPTSAQLGIEKLGFEEEQRELFETAIKKPYGMILVTGPTGSGKTVSLYTGLNMLNAPDVNISTAEDPVEITVPGINQVNVTNKTGMTFAAALRAFLRQDPDVIMVGEIRDLETAEIAVKAAQTGHLVLSTLHTNDAPQTLNRLAQMGVPAFNIASSVLMIMAQRLARRLCEHCKKPEDLPEKVLLDAGFDPAIIEDLTVYGPVGCDHCVKGYRGRVGIYQVMPITDALHDLILQGATALELEQQAEKEGINDLRKSGLLKVQNGITSLEEINRVTKE
ncbi:MAG TPA: type IV-A pilus assembly ATPase PilB [Crenotrichaceae bacterium]|nr:type IV-A pilus assembly ATPase PilB [Crenotrichaceae bacterium]